MSGTDGQRVERVPGARRARLTAVPGTDATPDLPAEDDDVPATSVTGTSGPNDERMKRDVPPHY